MQLQLTSKYDVGTKLQVKYNATIFDAEVEGVKFEHITKAREADCSSYIFYRLKLYGIKKPYSIMLDEPSLVSSMVN